MSDKDSRFNARGGVEAGPMRLRTSFWHGEPTKTKLNELNEMMSGQVIDRRSSKSAIIRGLIDFAYAFPDGEWRSWVRSWMRRPVARRAALSKPRKGKRKK